MLIFYIIARDDACQTALYYTVEVSNIHPSLRWFTLTFCPLHCVTSASSKSAWSGQVQMGDFLAHSGVSHSLIISSDRERRDVCLTDITIHRHIYRDAWLSLSLSGQSYTGFLPESLSDIWATKSSGNSWVIFYGFSSHDDNYYVK